MSLIRNIQSNIITRILAIILCVLPNVIYPLPDKFAQCHISLQIHRQFLGHIHQNIFAMPHPHSGCPFRVVVASANAHHHHGIDAEFGVNLTIKMKMNLPRKGVHEDKYIANDTAPTVPPL
jgi:hypothetical protein